MGLPDPGRPAVAPHAHGLQPAGERFEILDLHRRREHQGKDDTGKAVIFLDSDVITSDGIIYADAATATVRASFLDPAPITKPSAYSDVILDRYVVSYSRTDGKNRRASTSPTPSRAP